MQPALRVPVLCGGEIHHIELPVNMDGPIRLCHHRGSTASLALTWELSGKSRHHCMYALNEWRRMFKQTPLPRYYLERWWNECWRSALPTTEVALSERLLVQRMYGIYDGTDDYRKALKNAERKPKRDFAGEAEVLRRERAKQVVESWRERTGYGFGVNLHIATEPAEKAEWGDAKPIHVRFSRLRTGEPVANIRIHPDLYARSEVKLWPMSVHSAPSLHTHTYFDADYFRRHRKTRVCTEGFHLCKARNQFVRTATYTYINPDNTVTTSSERVEI